MELRGSVTARDAGELKEQLAPILPATAHVFVRAGDLEDVDTCVLQMLVSLRKTAAAFLIENPSAAFLRVADRAALRRELLAGWEAA